MSDLFPSGPGTPVLPLRDFLSRRTEIGFCADCAQDPDGACPDHDSISPDEAGRPF